MALSTAGIGSAGNESRTGRILMALAVALVLVTGAWLIGGREGFDTIGRGGTNLKLLPRVGNMAPELTAYRLDENLNVVEAKLSDYKGQPVWLNFWASWCQPCRAELPDIKEAYQQLQGTGIVMLAVSLDEPIQDAYLYAAQNDVNFVILSDPNRALVGQTYLINNFPTHIFIDAQGIVRDVELAPLSTEKALESAQKAISPGS